MESEDFGLDIDGQMYSLADLANQALDGIEEYRYQLLPAGLLAFTVEHDPEHTAFMAPFSYTDKETDEDVVGLHFNIRLKVMEVISVDKAMNARSGMVEVKVDQAVDQVFVKNFTCFNSKDTDKLAQTFGEVKAFLVDIGTATEGCSTFQDLLQASDGVKFQSKVTHRVNKDNPDIIRVQVSHMQRHIKPIV